MRGVKEGVRREGMKEGGGGRVEEGWMKKGGWSEEGGEGVHPVELKIYVD